MEFGRKTCEAICLPLASRDLEAKLDLAKAPFGVVFSMSCLRAYVLSCRSVHCNNMHSSSEEEEVLGALDESWKLRNTSQFLA